MEKNDNLLKVFAGNEALALLLKARLEEAGIPALVKNDYPGAWLLGVPPAIDLFIQESDMNEAAPIIKDFLQSNPL
jgi:hypothetical protein